MVAIIRRRCQKGWRDIVKLFSDRKILKVGTSCIWILYELWYIHTTSPTDIGVEGELACLLSISSNRSTVIDIILAYSFISNSMLYIMNARIYLLVCSITIKVFIKIYMILQHKILVTGGYAVQNLSTHKQPFKLTHQSWQVPSSYTALDEPCLLELLTNNFMSSSFRLSQFVSLRAFLDLQYGPQYFLLYHLQFMESI